MPRGRRFGILCALLGAAAVAAPAPSTAEEARAPPRHIRRAREIPLRVRPDAKEISPVHYTLYVTTDEGITWRATTDTEVRRTDSEFRFQAPADGRYGFRMVARDEAGHEGPQPTAGSVPEILVVVDSVPPAVTVLDPQEHQALRRGAPVAVRWQVMDANPGANPVSILVAYDGGNAFQAATAQPASETFVLHPPADARQMTIRIAAVDLANNRAESNPVTVDLSKTGGSQAVTAYRPVLETPREARPGFNVWYRVEGGGGPAGLREVNLWYTLDNGATWQGYGHDEDLVPPFYFLPPQPGRYGFYIDAVKMTQQAGGSPPTPQTPPQMTQVYDPLPPVVSLVSPRAHEFLRGGEPVEIRWTAADDLFIDKPISLWFTMHPPHWQPIADGIPNTGTYTWACPRADTTNLFIKVSAVDQAGNKTETQPVGPITVDAQGNARTRITGVQRVGGPAGRPSEGGTAQTLGALPSADACYRRGQYFMVFERQDLKAQEAFEEALRFNPDMVPALNDLAVLYFRGGAYGKALDTFVRARAANGDHPRVLINLALCYRRLERPDDALTQMHALGRLPMLGPEDATDAGTLLLGLTRDFLRLGNDAQAREASLLAAGLPNVPPDLVVTARSYAP